MEVKRKGLGVLEPFFEIKIFLMSVLFFPVQVSVVVILCVDLLKDHLPKVYNCDTFVEF